jgi:hypothetical protein
LELATRLVTSAGSSNSGSSSSRPSSEAEATRIARNLGVLVAGAVGAGIEIAFLLLAWGCGSDILSARRREVWPSSAEVSL